MVRAAGREQAAAPREMVEDGGTAPHGGRGLMEWAAGATEGARGWRAAGFHGVVF